MPAALWKIALGSLAWAVNAPAKPIPRAPCSKIANPAARADAGARATVAARAAARTRRRVDIRFLLVMTPAGRAKFDAKRRPRRVSMIWAARDRPGPVRRQGGRRASPQLP